ncbi:SGNH/GDSL hydrolase family protein [Streptomyces sp. NPDC001404]|uniref:SGNH/GDSL hydrolase family protein n=1 Tax=Streptomyces sp. NPDC001404 TaxID=3364571 RepID=UPI003678DAAD
MRFRRTAVCAATATALLAATAGTAHATPPIPTRMAALGDSLTRAVNSCTVGGGTLCARNSWSAGANPAVGSHYTRIKELNPEVLPYNEARAGATSADLAQQARAAVAEGGIDYVTIMIGGGDACAASEARMTSVGSFASRIRAALRILRSGAPDASVFVASVPDPLRVWELGKGNPAAVKAWKEGGVCQALLADPTSLAAGDAGRRERVRERVMDYNAALEKVCGEDAGCRYDGDAVFDHRFSAADVSTADYFHPSLVGQRTLAEVTYEAGFDW